MISEIGEILGRLKSKNVYDFEKEKSIMLLDRKATRIEFQKTELLEVKRFVALVKTSIAALTYLVRNVSFLSVTREVERGDRIMGAVNYKKTLVLRQRGSQNTNNVVCLEIHRSLNTPENRLLALILFSIAVYCDKYIAKEGALESGERIDAVTLQNLVYIRRYVTNLLSMKSIKQILPLAIDGLPYLENLFSSMINRIQLGKAPRYFVSIFKLFYRWKYFLWVVSTDAELLQHILRYHFFYLDNKNILYECWVFYKILDVIADKYDIKLIEDGRSQGVATFQSIDDAIRVTYQRRYETGWIDNDKLIEDTPDIAIELRNGLTIIIDAKNSRYKSSNPYPYREQMQTYMDSATAKYGILIHSIADSGLWKEIKRNGQKMIWTHLTPASSGIDVTSNAQNLDRIIQLTLTGTIASALR